MEEIDPEDCTIEPAGLDEKIGASRQQMTAATTAAKDSILMDGGSTNTDNELFLTISNLPKELRNLLAGGIAGMIAKTTVAPMDRIKILYQISSAKFYLRDIPKVVRNIVQEEGVSALWKGNFATMIRVFPYSGIQFMVFDRCKVLLLEEHERKYYQQQEQQQHGLSTTTTTQQQQPSLTSHKFGLTPFESLGAGMLAGVTSVIATYPLDLARAQLAVIRKKRNHYGTNAAVVGPQQQCHNLGFVEVLTGNYRQRGVAGLFRGISPTLLGILPYAGVAFALNEQGKRKIQTMTNRDLTTIERMQCGALAGLFAQTLTYPLEVTRRRMQTIGVVPTNGSDAAVDMLSSKIKTIPTTTTMATVSNATPPSMVTLMVDLYKEQGVRGFFKGVSMNWFKGPVAFSISFTVFDTLQVLFETPEEALLRSSRHH